MGAEQPAVVHFLSSIATMAIYAGLVILAVPAILLISALLMLWLVVGTISNEDYMSAESED